MHVRMHSRFSSRTYVGCGDDLRWSPGEAETRHLLTGRWCRRCCSLIEDGRGSAGVMWGLGN